MVATRGHAYLNVSFGMAPHQLHSSHEMAPIAPIAPLFQNFSHKDRGSETTPENIWLSDLNDTKEHDSKKPAPVPDASHAMPLDAIEVGGTVENSAIRKKRNCPSDSHPSFSPYALPPSNKLRKRDCPDDTPQRPLSACKYEGNNILFDLYIGSFLTESELFFHADNFFFCEARQMILKSLPDGGIKGDESSRKQTLDTILSHVSSEMEDIPPEKQLWFQDLQQRKLPAIHNRERRRPHRKSHGKIGFVELSQAVSRRWRKLTTDKVNFYQKLAKLDMNRFKTAVVTYNMERIKTGLPVLEI